MRKFNREINIFTLSALDLFAAALGAFILLTVIQFPYTKKNEDIVNAKRAAEAQLKQCQSDLNSAKNETEQYKADLNGARNEANKCKADFNGARNEANKYKADLNGARNEANKCKIRLKETFLAVVLKWDTQKQDVDLHVIDPAGHEFYFSKHNRNRSHFASVDAEISVDQVVGPGVEIWEYYKAVEGTYKLYANLYARKGNSKNPKVKTAVYYRDGVKKLTVKILTKEKKKVLLGIIKVNATGEVEFE
ncbi:MAG: hypothetical protein KAH84_13180 [Thiomargarita sp.]|nr:hypothetical protein [Thiomargarita sp.]